MTLLDSQELMATKYEEHVDIAYAPPGPPHLNKDKDSSN